MNQNQQPPLELTIRTKSGIIFQNQVKAVTSSNDKGIFDILSQHANFISIIKDAIIIHKLDNSEQKIPIEKAVLKVMSNKVDIYLGIESNQNV